MIARKRQSTNRRSPYQKRRKMTTGRYVGLRPTYRGFTPRAFSRGEWKYTDLGVNVQVDTATAVYLLNGLQPGTGASQRIGMKVSIRSVEIQMTDEATAGTGVDQVHAWGIVLDHQANGAAPALTDFITGGTPWGLRNLTNRKRFKMLLRKRTCINATGEAGTKRDHKIYMKFRRPIIVEFNAGVAGTIADIVTNSMFLWVSGSAAAGATAGRLIGNIRIRYQDM